MAPWIGAFRRRIATMTVLTCAVVLVDATAGPGIPPPPCTPTLALAPFLHERPPACWRPYDDASPWNLELTPAAQLDPRSRTLVENVGVPDHVVAGWAGTDRD